MEALLGLLAMIALSGSWVLQVIVAKRYDVGWRLAALVPLSVIGR